MTIHLTTERLLVYYTYSATFLKARKSAIHMKYWPASFGDRTDDVSCLESLIPVCPCDGNRDSIVNLPRRRQHILLVKAVTRFALLITHRIPSSPNPFPFPPLKQPL